METDTNNEDDDELRFEEAEDEDAETPPSAEDVAMHIPKNLRDSLGSGSRDAAPAGFTSTKRARKATARFADLEAKGQSYSQAEDDAASSPRPPPTTARPARSAATRRSTARARPRRMYSGRSTTRGARTTATATSRRSPAGLSWPGAGARKAMFCGATAVGRRACSCVATRRTTSQHYTCRV